MTKNKKLFKSVGIVSFFTLISRILGLIRDRVIAYLFGTSWISEAFVVAFRIPNTLRHLIGEGASNAAVIPVLSDYLHKNSHEEFWRISNILFNFFAVILLGVSIAGVIFSPVIVRIIAVGFTDNPEKLALTIKLTKIMFSFIFFIGMFAYLMGVLNTLKHFAYPAAGSCFLNLTLIVFGLWLAPRFAEPVVGMAIAVLIGGFLQLLVQIPILIKKGFKFKPTLEFRHPAVARIMKLIAPRIIGSSIYQLNVFVDTIFGSFSNVVGAGAIAALYFSNRLIQFPTAIFGNSLATASLPTMSQYAAKGEMAELKNLLHISLKSSLVLLIPSACGLMFLAHPIIQILFETGKFTSYSTNITAIALIFYCFGLFAYSGTRVVTVCFYALKDTVTPVKITFICLLVNVFLNLLFMHPLKIGGLALATSISAFLNFFLLLYYLRKKLGSLGLSKLGDDLKTVLMISLFMGIVARTAYVFFLNITNNILSLIVAIGLGTAVFFIAAWKFGLFKNVKIKLFK